MRAEVETCSVECPLYFGDGEGRNISHICIARIDKDPTPNECYIGRECVYGYSVGEIERRFQELNNLERMSHGG